ncbi:MAG: NADH-quinone oxidoreductase subunit NuoN [Actinomycetota bacterium]
MPIQAPSLDLIPVLPEIILAAVALALLVGGAVLRREDPRLGGVVSLLAVAGAAWASITLWDREGEAEVLGGMVATDRYAVFFRLLILAATATTVGLAHHYFQRTPEDHRGEFYPLLLLAASGMTLLVSAANLLMVFLALEVLSLSLYILTGFSPRRPASQEGSMKYFLLGAFSSAFLLYGIAMAYGATGTTSISGIGRALAGRTEAPALALVAMGLLAVGLGFKVAAVPFHQWTPDVYQGAPTPVTAFMSAGTKVAGFAALLRVFMVALHPLQWEWRPFLWGLAAITMVVGSVLAIAQSDVKRMLAYSSIAHAGFILVGVTAASQAGISAAMFYLVAYVAMILGAFGVVLVVSGRGEERTGLPAYAGLAERSPALAGLLALFLLSLAGIPPTAGFIAKVSVFSAAIQAGYWPLALIAVLSSVVAAYFYIRVIVLMYMEQPEESAGLLTSPAAGIALAPAALATLVLGVFPSLLFTVLETASVLRL